MKKDRKSIKQKRKEKEKFKEALKVVQLKPLMPTIYTAEKRAELRKFEKELLSKCESKEDIEK